MESLVTASASYQMFFAAGNHCQKNLDTYHHWFGLSGIASREVLRIFIRKERLSPVNSWLVRAFALHHKLLFNSVEMSKIIYDYLLVFDFLLFLFGQVFNLALVVFSLSDELFFFIFGMV